jgi:hypothetical protein
MDITFNGGKVVSFGDRARMKWARFDHKSERLTVFVKNGQELNFLLNELPEDVKKIALLHGLKQKLADTCAANLTADEDVNSLVDMWGRLNQNEWFAKEREGSGGMLAEAIFRVMGGDRVKIAEKLKAMSAKDKAALESNPKVKAEMDKIREEKGRDVKPVDDDALKGMFE